MKLVINTSIFEITLKDSNDKTIFAHTADNIRTAVDITGFALEISTIKEAIDRFFQQLESKPE